MNRDRTLARELHYVLPEAATMKMMKALAGLGVAAAVAMLVGCGSAPDQGEDTASAEQPLPMCDPEMGCGGGGGSRGYDYTITSGCSMDSTASCCVGGGRDLSQDDRCEAALYAAGCKASPGSTSIHMRAIHQDWNGTWWFRAACPGTLDSWYYLPAFGWVTPRNACGAWASNPGFEPAYPYSSNFSQHFQVNAFKCYDALANTPITSTYAGWQNFVFDPVCPSCTVKPPIE